MPLTYCSGCRCSLIYDPERNPDALCDNCERERARVKVPMLEAALWGALLQVGGKVEISRCVIQDARKRVVVFEDPATGNLIARIH